jgi:integrase
VLQATASLKPEEKLFVLTLAWTGARVSEVLALTPSSFQPEPAVVAIRTLKRRRHHVREVPIPPTLLTAIDQQFCLSALQRDSQRSDRRLWCWSRTTAWRLIKRVMQSEGITGVRACPKGLRHAFGVGTLAAGVPLNLTQRWLGHARLETTAIYTGLCGAEETAFARRFWGTIEEPWLHALGCQ